MKNTSKRANIVLLMADQMRRDAVGAYGSPWARTPRLDALADEGCRFTHAFSPNPVCIPARHNLLTGLPARFHGYWRNSQQPFDLDLPVMPRLLANAGYATQAVGKMHFQPERRHHGFDRMLLAEHTSTHRQDDDYMRYLKSVGLGHIRNVYGAFNLIRFQPQRSLIDEKHHVSTWVADRSVAFVEANQNRPFFLFASWMQPHAPFSAPSSWAEHMTGAAIPDPVERLSPLPEKARRYARHEDIISRAQLRRSRELYHTCVSLIDKNVGRILDRLDQLGLAENTLVVFLADHGDMLGDLGCVNKGLPYHFCCRVPMIARLPGRLAGGTVRTEFVDLNDILPTFLDRAGVTYPDPHALPGESLLAETPAKDRTVQYIEDDHGPRRWISLQDVSHQYVYWSDGYEELYDLAYDPDQRRDLMQSERSADDEAARERLRSQLIEYERRWGMPGAVVDGDLTVDPTPEWTDRRHNKFETWPENLTDPAEQRAINTNEYEILQMTRDEPLTELHRLDLDAWIEAGGRPEFARELATASKDTLIEAYAR